MGHGQEVELSPMAEVASIIREVRAQKKEFAAEKKPVSSKPVLTGSKPEVSKSSDKQNLRKNVETEPIADESVTVKFESLNMGKAEQNDSADLISTATINTVLIESPVCERPKVEQNDTALLNGKISSETAKQEHSEVPGQSELPEQSELTEQSELPEYSGLSVSKKELGVSSGENSRTDSLPISVRFSAGDSDGSEKTVPTLSEPPVPVLEIDRKPVPVKNLKAILKQGKNQTRIHPSTKQGLNYGHPNILGI